jgi:hypothetical protein
MTIINGTSRHNAFRTAAWLAGEEDDASTGILLPKTDRNRIDGETTL